MTKVGTQGRPDQEPIMSKFKESKFGILELKSWCPYTSYNYTHFLDEHTSGLSI